jgi:hypothetical protein
MRNNVPTVRRFALAAAVAALTLATTSIAQEPGELPSLATGSRQEEDHLLGGHRFLIPQLQESPFVVTAFTSRTGGGYDSVEDVPFGTLGPRDLRFGGLQQELDLQVRLARWMGLFAEVSGTAIVGLNGRSLLLRTGDLQGDFRGGAIFRFFRSEDTGTQLSGRIGGGFGTGRELQLLPLLQSLSDQPVASVQAIVDGELSSFLLVPTREGSGRASVHLAQVLSEVFSLQAALGVTALQRTQRPYDPVTDENVAETDRGVRGDGAVALAMDLAPIRVPAALMLEYRYTVGEPAVRADVGSGHLVGASLFYSGRSDFEVGLEGAYLLRGERLEGLDSTGKAVESEPVHRTIGAMVVRYTW